METGINWALKPEPWCWVGPAFKEQVQAIVNGFAPKPTPKKPVHDGAANLRVLRIKAGLSQRALARLARCSQNAISRLENGRSGSNSLWNRIDHVLSNR